MYYSKAIKNSSRYSGRFGYNWWPSTISYNLTFNSLLTAPTMLNFSKSKLFYGEFLFDQSILDINLS